MSTSPKLNSRDTALLGILSSEANREAISQALSIALSVTQPNTDVIESFAAALIQPIRYTVSEDGLTVTDTTTGLMWQQAGGDKALTFKSAEDYVKSLNDAAFGGHSDWRLPSYHELPSIVDITRSSPAIDPIFNCRNEWYWTGTVRASSSVLVWIVNFHHGDVSLSHRYYGAFVRAVRSASPAGQ